LWFRNPEEGGWGPEFQTVRNDSDRSYHQSSIERTIEQLSAVAVLARETPAPTEDSPPGDRTFEPCVDRAIHFAHAARAKSGCDFVGAKSCAWNKDHAWQGL
jgi:hypothetical protein